MVIDPEMLEVAVAAAKRLSFHGELKHIGTGASKETFSCLSSDNKPIALKIINPEHCSLARTEREIGILLRCDSPFISKLYDYGFFDFGDKRYCYVVEEFLDGGTLSERIDTKTLTPTTVKSYALALVQAIKYLKDNSIVHRDIKPDNIMFRKDSIAPVLVDLGVARDLLNTSLTPDWVSQGPGTPLFSAPEQLNNEKRLIDWRTDQFSLGIVLGICLTKRHPYQTNGMTLPEIVMAIAARKHCHDSFRTKMGELGFPSLVKMIEPWSIRRYQSPQEIEQALNT